MLEQSFSDCELDVVGIQEGRTKHSQCKSGCVHKMFVAGRDEMHCYGVQTWVKRVPEIIVYGWQVHSPRLLEVKLVYKANKGVIVVFSAHAPHESSDPDTKNLFWSSLCSAVQVAQGRANFVVVCIDANARVGSVAIPGIIGSHDACKENDNSIRFRSAMSDLSLSVVNTFVHTDRAWVSSYGTEHRIDYICVSALLQSHASQVATLADIDLSTADRIDHRVVFVCFVSMFRFLNMHVYQYPPRPAWLYERPCQTYISTYIYA